MGADDGISVHFQRRFGNTADNFLVTNNQNDATAPRRSSRTELCFAFSLARAGKSTLNVVPVPGWL